MSDNSENEQSKQSDNFDEKAEIEKLQEKIKKMSSTSENSDEFITGNPELLNDDDMQTSSPEEILAPFLDNSSDEDKEELRPKKFVVTANVDNVEFFDSLSVEERSEVFNEILADYIKKVDKIKGKKHLKKILIHLTIALLTLIVALPLLFFIVNQSIHFTVLNYKHAQTNFEKLYENHGVSVKPVKRR